MQSDRSGDALYRAVAVSLAVLFVLAGVPTGTVALPAHAVDGPATDAVRSPSVDCSVFDTEYDRLWTEFLRLGDEMSRLTTAWNEAAEPIRDDDDIPPFTKAAMLGEIQEQYLPRIQALNAVRGDLVDRMRTLNSAERACKGRRLDDDLELRRNAVSAFESSVEDLSRKIDEWERSVDLENLQQCVYQSGRGEDMGLTCPPTGWSVDGSEGEEWTFVGERRTDEGMYVQTYLSPDGATVYDVYEGSVPLRDVLDPRWFKHWVIDNILGGITGHSDQTTQAMDYARETEATLAPGQEHVTVGHSRGCKQAVAAARATGSRAICFNGAGLPKNTVPKYLHDRGYSDQEIRVLQSRSEITSIVTTNDRLTNLQEHVPVVNAVMPDVPGQQIVLEPAPDSEHSGHSLENVIEASKRRVVELDEHRSLLQSTIDELNGEN